MVEAVLLDAIEGTPLVALLAAERVEVPLALTLLAALEIVELLALDLLLAQQFLVETRPITECRRRLTRHGRRVAGLRQRRRGRADEPGKKRQEGAAGLGHWVPWLAARQRAPPPGGSGQDLTRS